jgi:acyl carrier protein
MPPLADGGAMRVSPVAPAGGFAGATVGTVATPPHALSISRITSLRMLDESAIAMPCASVPRMEVEERVRSYVVESARLSEPPGDHDKLIDKGYIASVQVLDLAGFLEDTFHIELRAVDLVPENLQTISKIAEMVRTRLKASR